MKDNIFSYLFKQYALTLYIAILVVCTLVLSDLFIYKSLTPFYLSIIAAGLLMIIAGILLGFQKSFQLKLTLPILITSMWAAYIIFQGIVITHNFNSFHSYLLSCCVLIVSLYLIFRVQIINYTALTTTISLIAAIEAMICVFQYTGSIRSLDNSFPATGTWNNPNVTAMFLVMSLPSTFYIVVEGRKLYRQVAVAIIVVTVTAILLLQCRTAFIGVITVFAILFNYKFKLRKLLTSGKNRSSIIILLAFCMAVAIPLANYIYNTKKASADGRRLIWKLSTTMILDRPFTGYGYGTFEKNYNLEQSRYFSSGNGTAAEYEHATFVNMGYNEYLQNAIEGGFFGITFLGSLIYSLLSNKLSAYGSGTDLKSNEKQGYYCCYAGIVAFAIMSIFNFSILAIPAMVLFVIWVALLATYPGQRSFNLNIGYARRAGIGICLATSGAWFLYYNVSVAYCDILNKRAEIEAVQSNYPQAITILKPLSLYLNNHESYWTNYATVLMSQNEYKAAINCLNKAKFFSSNPEIYLNSAVCYQKIGNYKNAENDYIIARFIEPSRLAPKFALMNLYWQQKDTTKSINIAREIIEEHPKVPSKKAEQYKYLAVLLLKKLKVQTYTQSPETPMSSVKLPILHKNL